MFSYTSLQSKVFASHRIAFALTNRLGGVSVAPFDTLNLGFHVGDTRSSVESNHNIIANAFCERFSLGFTPDIHYLTQIHSDKVIKLESSDDSAVLDSISSRRSIELGEADAIITNVSYKLCLVMVADCNPILIYDAEHRAMAVIHAGRQGVLNGIVSNAMKQMAQAYGTIAQSSLVYVGSSIRSCCYEVGSEIVKIAEEAGMRDGIMRNNGVYKLDLIACLLKQFENLGIPRTHIEISSQCSCCEKSLYSYRREGRTGRFGLLAMLL